MGNPHAVFFVADLDSIDLERLGAVLERHPFFPERVNVGVARVIDPARLRLRVFERGVGITRACGSGACAALVAAARRGLTGRVATVEMDGGALDVAWGVDGRVALTGATAIAFHGHLDALLARHP
jgi:diaminopimelate epimerase